MDLLKKEIAHILFDIQAIQFQTDEPVRFKSGMLSPVYTDNRRLPFHPHHWKRVIEGFGDLIRAKEIRFDVIAGLEAAGIPHSSALGFSMNKPSVFVRKEAKLHGQRKRIEGGEVEGLRVLLIEDLVTTGSTSLSGIEALRDEGAILEDSLAITSYGLNEMYEGFEQAGVRLHTLTNFETILAEARLTGYLNDEQFAIIEKWQADPYGWGQ